MPRVRLLIDMEQDGAIGDILNLGKKQAKEIIAKGWAELVEDVPSDKTTKKKRKRKSKTEKKSSNLEIIARQLADAAIAQELELSTIESYLTFAEAEGIKDVTKGIAGLARGYVQREYKHRADKQKKKGREKKKKSSALQITSQDVAENLARFILEKAFTPSSITAIQGIALGAGIVGVTREIAALTKELLKREYKRLDDEMEEEEERKPTIAKQIINIVRDNNILLFTDDRTESYAQIPREDHIKILRIEGRAFKKYLTYQYQELTERVPNSSALKDAVNSLSASAINKGPSYKLYNRVAEYDGAIWYDMTNKKWEVIRIDENGWEILPSTPIPLFYRFDHQRPQVYPANSEDKSPEQLKARLMELMLFHNHANKSNQILDVISLIFSLVPGVPHPASLVFGPAGSGKTLGFHRPIKLLIDPSSVDQGLSLPIKKGDFPLQLERHYFIVYSNLTKLRWWQSDMFCRAIDGAADETRKLYTDAEIYAFQYLRCIGLNGIPLVATQDDLMDRSILFPLDSIAREERMDEEELFKKFEDVRPVIFGAMLDALSAAMKLRPSIKLHYIERLGAFTKWACAIAEALGYEHKDFLDAYAANRSTANIEVIDADIVARNIMAFMEEKDAWVGSPRQLFEELEVFVFGKKEKRPRYWPKDEMSLGKKIVLIAQSLERSGLIVSSSKSGGRIKTLEWHEGYGPDASQSTFDVRELKGELESPRREPKNDNEGEMSQIGGFLDLGQHGHLDSTPSVGTEERKLKIKKEKRIYNKGKSPAQVPVLPEVKEPSNLNGFLEESLVDSDKPKPKKVKKSKRRPLIRTVKEFSDWLSKLPNAGQRGFLGAEVKKVYGDNYTEQLNKWIDRGWIEQKGKTLMWWISDEGKSALAGGYIGVEESD